MSWWSLECDFRYLSHDFDGDMTIIDHPPDDSLVYLSYSSPVPRAPSSIASAPQSSV